jgi:hypothetical protein
MVRFYWYGLSVIYLTCCIAGVILGYAWGFSASMLGMGIGATVAAGITMVLYASERMEIAFYAVLSFSFILAVFWLFDTYSSVRL